MSMIELYKRLSINALVALVSTVSVAANSVQLLSIIGFDKQSKWLGQNPFVLISIIYASILCYVIYITFSIYNHLKGEVDRAKYSIDDLTHLVKNKQDEYKLLESEIARYIGIVHQDVVTGIPNQRKFEKDIDRFAKISSIRDPYQVIMIDIINFRKINEIYGYRTGDEVMRLIAQNIYNSMRRDEEAYKMPRLETDDSIDNNIHSMQRIYRKYTGGDEFIFLIRSQQVGAVGFVNRLRKQFIDQLNPMISKLLNAEYSLNFRACIVPLLPNDVFEEVVDRIDHFMRKTTEEGGRYSVCCFDNEKSDDFDKTSNEYRIYKEMETNFQRG